MQCQHRWQKVLNPELIKGPWTKEEDQRVSSLFVGVWITITNSPQHCWMFPSLKKQVKCANRKLRSPFPYFPWMKAAFCKFSKIILRMITLTRYITLKHRLFLVCLSEGDRELVQKYGPKRWSVIAKHLKGRIGVVGRGGITTWIQKLRKPPGQKRKTELFTRHTRDLGEQMGRNRKATAWTVIICQKIYWLGRMRERYGTFCFKMYGEWIMFYWWCMFPLDKPDP